MVIVSAIDELFTFKDNWPRLSELINSFVESTTGGIAQHGLLALGLVTIGIASWGLWRDHQRQSNGSWARVNPAYESDLAAIDGNWRLDSIANEETILIVVGNTTTAEVLDRAMAARVRERIDALGKGHPYRRGLVLSHAAIAEVNMAENREMIKKCPKIFIGGAPANKSTAAFLGIANDKNKKAMRLGSGYFLYLDDGGIPQVALWGDMAKNTESAVSAYITGKRGLREFTTNCWKSAA